jgi:hypothetical protein
MTPEPSYVRKADWAEKHLIDLTLRLALFAAKHPYEVVDPVKGKRGERFSRLVFTEGPDPDIGLIAGDVAYNLRASFDYLIGSLVPSSARSSVLCPILREPVWEIPHVSTENKELTKSRDRWRSLTRHIGSEGAIAALKELMPLDSRRLPPQVHALDVINRLANKDRHQRLPILTWGLADARATGVMRRSGEIRPLSIPDTDPLRHGIRNKALIPVPDGVAYVKLRGTAVVLIRVGQEWENFRIPESFWVALNWLRNEAFPAIAPFSRKS